MKMKTLSICSFLCLTLLTTGCASKKYVYMTYVTKDSAPVQSVDRNAQAELSQASVSAEKSLQNLSAIEESTHPSAKIPAPVNAADVGMAQHTTVDWAGPVEPLLAKLAKASNYKLQVLGHEPALPVLVTVRANNSTIASIVRNASYQVVKKAKITVYPSTKTLELRYFQL